METDILQLLHERELLRRHIAALEQENAALNRRIAELETMVYAEEPTADHVQKE